MRLVVVCYYRAVIVREVCLVTGFNSIVLVNLILVVELYLEVATLVISCLELVAFVCRSR